MKQSTWQLKLQQNFVKSLNKGFFFLTMKRAVATFASALLFSCTSPLEEVVSTVQEPYMRTHNKQWFYPKKRDTMQYQYGDTTLKYYPNELLEVSMPSAKQVFGHVGDQCGVYVLDKESHIYASTREFVLVDTNGERHLEKFEFFFRRLPREQKTFEHYLFILDSLHFYRSK